MNVEFTITDRAYRLEATSYGCDIFVNGGYVDTVQSDVQQSKTYWLGRGIERLFELVIDKKKNQS